MKIIENPKLQAKGAPAGPLDEMISSLRFGRSWTQDMQAQEGLLTALDRALDHRYTMLRGVTLEGLDIPIPLVLVGPTGVRVLYPNPSRGVFRARGDLWEQMDDNDRAFRPAMPNLMTRVQLMAQAVAAYLTAQEMGQPEVEAVLFFSDPGTHVDSVRPTVRIVLADGIDRYLAGLLQSHEYLDKQDVQHIVGALTKSMGPLPDESPFPERDAFDFLDERKASRLSTLAENMPRGQGVVSTLQKIPFSNRQWFFLGCLGIVNILILIGFVVYILLTS